MLNKALRERIYTEIEDYLNSETYFIDLGTGDKTEEVTDLTLDIPGEIDRDATTVKTLDDSTKELSLTYRIDSVEANHLLHQSQETGDSDAGVGGTNYEAQSFQVDYDCSIPSIDLYMKYNSGTNDSVKVEVCNDDSGKPGSTLTDGSTTITSFSDTSYTWKRFDFGANPPALTKNTTYWIKVTSTSSDADAYYLNYISTDEYSSGERAYSSDGGSSWTTGTGNDETFKVNIDKFVENGVFDESTSGDMYARNTHSPQTKNTDIEYKFTYVIEYDVSI